MVIDKKKVVAIIQARVTSSRLPGKVLKDLAGKTLIQRVVERVNLSHSVDEVWLATSKDPADDLLEMASKELPIRLFRGDLTNVLSRYAETARLSKADIIIRVTADNPMTEPRFIEEGIRVLMEEQLDYVSYDSIPYGAGIEVVSKKALFETERSASESEDLEHVTMFIRKNPDIFKLRILLPPQELAHPNIRVTIDTLEDYVNMYRLFFSYKNESSQELTLEKAIKYLEN
jgi:spore coat polysaccharide biosynthesis protein SpsF